MKSIKYILVLLIFSSSVYSRCLLCSVPPINEWNIHMASNEYADEIKKKKKKEEQIFIYYIYSGNIWYFFLFTLYRFYNRRKTTFG